MIMTDANANHNSDDYSSDVVSVAIAVAPPPTLSSRRLPTSYHTGRSYHLLSFALNLLLIIAIIVVIASGGYSPKFPLTFFLLFFSMLGYYGEAFCRSPTLRFLKNRVTPSDSKSLMCALQIAAPRIKMKVSCYHMETRHRTRSVTDSKGKSHNEHYTERVKVETFAADRDKTFRSWADVSGDLPSVFSDQNLQRSSSGETKTDLEASQFPPGKDEQQQQKQNRVEVFVPKFRVLQVMLSSSYEAYDAATKSHLLIEEETFCAEHRGKDNEMDFVEELLIQGHQPSIMIIDGKRPAQLTQFWYTFWTMLFCSWGYRMWVESLSSRVEWHLKKIVSIGDLQCEIERDSSAPIVRSDTLRFVSAFDCNIPIAESVQQEHAIIFQEDLPAVAVVPR